MTNIASGRLLLLRLLVLVLLAASAAAANHTGPGDGPSRRLAQRSVPEFEAMLNAMKCALRIVGLQVSEHHNNMLMCCGLWKMKAYMKDTADQVCENPAQSKRVFDNIMTDELIYGTFTRSVLRDDSLDCRRYPEGSAACDRLWAFITLAMVLFLLILLLLVFGCALACLCWHRYRRRYRRLLQCKLADLDQNEKDRFLASESTQTRPRWRLANLRQAVMPKTRPRGPAAGALPPTATRKPAAAGFNNNKVLYKSDDSSLTFGASAGGKLTPDSAVPPSSNSTSQSTSTASLNATAPAAPDQP